MISATVWHVVVAMSANFHDESSKESDDRFGTTIPHYGAHGVKFHVWLNKRLAVHTVVPEGTAPEDVVHVYQDIENLPDGEVRILYSLVLPPFLDSEGELNTSLESSSSYKD